MRRLLRIDSPSPSGPDARSAGFTLIELALTMLIVVEILIGAGIAFDVHNRMARIQTQITDMQQSLRIAQYDMSRTMRMEEVPLQQVQPLPAGQ